ncbi:hypothetical protein ACQ4M3_20750 [Leptolyngbya sp. AN03gr2]|uniref:hypothetical protein n=1 Tax=unclassified Leptolyngbya TaxID=2650499 RepID=UPI003D31F5F8
MSQHVTPKIATKSKIAFIDLIRPEMGNPYFGGLELQKAIEVYRWMCQTAQPYRSHRTYHGNPYGNDAISLLNGQPTIVGNDSTPNPFTANWEEEMRSRFHSVLLSNLAQPEAERWKHDYQINLMKTRIVPMRYYAEQLPQYPYIQTRGFRNAIDQLFSLLGRSLNYSPNPFHLEAKVISEIKFNVYPTYSIALHYGYHITDYTSWCVYFYAQPDELLYDWATRVYVEILSKLTPESEDPPANLYA